ncbi:energy-coupling factor ABC transporter permease [Egicoccus sp. AB-alg6-2]|uniref:energy-coupling factor ABC transporter permease n=1 Tax=Egicoccus sp. AB-alg6-2 TaxID=3242692 RepID=UPI00359D1074
MHAPDGFLTLPAAVGTGLISAGAVGAALRQSREQLGEQQVPLAGLTAAFVFAAQMVNFPVAAGTTGHLLGGALAAVLLGPWVGMLVVTVVVVVQALVFADGGLSALGYNVLNMAVVTSLGGWGVFRLGRRLLPATRTGVAVAAGVAGFAAVVLSAVAFSLQWLVGASAPVPFDRVFVAMVGVHLLIGVGEGVITGLTVAAVLRTRADLVAGASDLRVGAAAGPGLRRFVLGGVAVSLLVAAGVAQFAVDDPDGLERVAEDTGFAAAEREHALANSIFADYATAGVANESTSLAVAGIAGTVLTLAIGGGLFSAVRGRAPGAGRPRRHPVGG